MSSVQHERSRKRLPPFPTRQMTILGMYPNPRTCLRDLTDFSESTLPDMRANCLYVHFPLRLLHGQGLQSHQRRFPDIRLRRNGDLRLCIRGVLLRSGMGKIERQDWPETSPPHRAIRNGFEHVDIWICAQSAGCIVGSGSWRPSQWVRRASTEPLNNLLTHRGYRNIGVLQTTVAEMVTVKEHQRKLRFLLCETFPLTR